MAGKAPPSARLAQWASGVSEFSSEYGVRRDCVCVCEKLSFALFDCGNQDDFYSASRLSGPPTVFPQLRDAPTTWAPRYFGDRAAGGTDFAVLEFEVAVVPVRRMRTRHELFFSAHFLDCMHLFLLFFDDDRK